MLCNRVGLWDLWYNKKKTSMILKTKNKVIAGIVSVLIITTMFMVFFLILKIISH